MKKKYFEPEIEDIFLDDENIITDASTGDGNADDGSGLNEDAELGL